MRGEGGGDWTHSRGVAKAFVLAKAGRGNRTLVFSLEGYCSTIELHPHSDPTAPLHFSCPSRPWPGSSGIKQPLSGKWLERVLWRNHPSRRAFEHAYSGECRIRTCEGVSHQIYSLTPLTARETPLLLPTLCTVRQMLRARMCCWCAWCWMPAGDVRWLVVSSRSGRWRKVAERGRADCRQMLRLLLAGHAELAAGVEPATC